MTSRLIYFLIPIILIILTNPVDAVCNDTDSDGVGDSVITVDTSGSCTNIQNAVNNASASHSQTNHVGGSYDSDVNTRFGEKINITKGITINKVGFYCERDGSGLGTAYIRVRYCSNDTIMHSTSFDADSISAGQTWNEITLDSSVTVPGDTCVRVMMEHNGGFDYIRWRNGNYSATDSWGTGTYYAGGYSSMDPAAYYINYSHTVSIEPGTYTENVDISNPYTDIIGNSSNRNDVRVEPSSLDNVFDFQSGSEYSSLKNLTVKLVESGGPPPPSIKVGSGVGDVSFFNLNASVGWRAFYVEGDRCNLEDIYSEEVTKVLYQNSADFSVRDYEYDSKSVDDVHDIFDINSQGNVTLENLTLYNANANSGYNMIHIDGSGVSILNSTIYNNVKHAISLSGTADQCTIKNNKLYDSDDLLDFASGVTGLTFENNTIGDGTYSTVINKINDLSGSFTISDVTSPPSDPQYQENINKYLNISGIGSGEYLEFLAEYEDADIPSNTQEDLLDIWRYDGNWTDSGFYSSTYHDTTNNIIGANITSSSTFAILGETPFVPPAPTGITSTTGNFYIDYSWSAGSGNVTNSYNVSVDATNNSLDGWHNGTTNSFNCTGLGGHGYCDISVYAYNDTSVGALSTSSATDNVTVPNNPPDITDATDVSIIEGDSISIDFNYTDIEGDSATFSGYEMIDDFEDGGLGEYTGDKNMFVVDQEAQKEGTYVLHGYYMGQADITSSSGLPYYPQEGDKFEFWWKDKSGDSSYDSAYGRVYFGSELFYLGMSSDIGYFKIGNGTVNDTYDASIDTGWHKVVVNWTATNITVDLYDGDGTTLITTVYLENPGTASGNDIKFWIDGGSSWVSDHFWDDFKRIGVTDGTLNTNTGEYTWNTVTGDNGTYTRKFVVEDEYSGTDYYTALVDVLVASSVGRPINLKATTGNFWINWTWDPGVNTETFNITKDDGTWLNDTTQEYYNASGLNPHDYWNISVRGWNASVTVKKLSNASSGLQQIPNNPITITNVSNPTIWERDTVSIDFNYDDVDGDSGTFDTNATQGSIDTGTGEYTWNTKEDENGTYEWTFNVSDGWGSVSNHTPTITVKRDGYVTNLPAGKWAVLYSDQGIDATETVVDTTEDILLGNNQYKDYAALLEVNLTGNTSFQGIEFDVDTSTPARAYLHNTSGIVNITNKSLLVRSNYVVWDKVYVCPDAESLSDVSASCSNKVTLDVGETGDGYTLSEVTINGTDYLKVAGVTGTGAGEVEPPDPYIKSIYNSITQDNSETLTINPDTTVQFEATASQAVLWHWDGVATYSGDGSTSTTGERTFSTTGDYEVSVYGSNTNGSTSTATWEISVVSEAQPTPTETEEAIGPAPPEEYDIWEALSEWSTWIISVLVIVGVAYMARVIYLRVVQ